MFLEQTGAVRYRRSRRMTFRTCWRRRGLMPAGSPGRQGFLAAAGSFRQDLLDLGAQTLGRRIVGIEDPRQCLEMAAILIAHRHLHLIDLAAGAAHRALVRDLSHDGGLPS
jgi:hypothetical protein